MQFQYTPYILPLLVSAVISGWMAVYVWRRRQTTRGADMLALLAVAITEWSLGYALEIAGADLPTKIFWGKSQYFGIVTAPLFWFVFAYLHSNQGNWLTRRRMAYLSIVPLITLALTLTTEWHGLIWQNMHIDTTGQFSALDMAHGFWFWAHSAYSYILLLAGTILLLRTIVRLQGQYRRQAAALLIAVLSPWAANVIFLSGLSPIPNLDLTPFAFTISVVALTWGIISFQLIDISPVARGAVVDEMKDGVIVLDTQNRIADINLSAQKAIGISASQAIGQKALEALKPWSTLIKRYENTLEAEDEVSLGEGESQVWYELHLSPLYDSRKRPLGRVITVRNTTERKRVETLLRESETRYRQFIENASDIIYRTDASGHFTFCNPVALRLMGFASETEVLGKHFLELASPDWHHLMKRFYDRQFVTGELNTYFEFPAITADGHELWLGQNVQIIRDGGKIIGFQAVARDITTRKQAETALQEAELKYRTLVEQLPIVVYKDAADGAGKTIYISPQVETLLGYSLTEWEQDLTFWQKITHPDDLERALTAVKDVLSQGHSSAEYRLLARNRVVWVHNEATLVRDEAGRPLFVQGILEDITERKRAEDQIRKLSQAVEQSASTIVITDTGGMIEYANQKFTETTGYTLEEAIGKTPRILKSGEQSLEFYQELWKTIRAGQVWRGTFHNKRKDESLYWESATIAPVRNPDGEVTHYLAVKDDITRQKEIEEAIQRSHQTQSVLNSLLRLSLEDQTLNEMLERALDIILTIPWLPMQPKGGIFLVEDQPGILVLKSEKNLGASILTLCARVPFGRCLCGRAAASGQIQFADCVDERHENRYDGIQPHGHYNIPILFRNEVMGVLVVYINEGQSRDPLETAFLEMAANTLADMIRDKRAEEALAIARDQAVEANRAKSQLLAKVSHELRTPLGGVLGYAELLHSNAFGTLEEKQAQATAHIIESTHYLTAMVNELLDEAQIESGSLKLNIHRFAPREMLAGIEQNLSMLARKKGLALTTTVAPNLPENLYGDENRLRQILINLTGNAVKFTEAGQIHISFSQVDPAHWSLQISDSGVGIPKEAQSYIFEPFRQVDNAITRNNRGTGLGLSITKNLVALMGGQITLESETGQGSTFTVLLPIVEVEENIQ